jgi:hypothetical protein
MQDATFPGFLRFANFDAALPLLRNKLRLFEMCCSSPDGTLEILIGSASFIFDKKSMMGLEKQFLKQAFSKGL